jgi:hypothetical protein
MGDKIATGYRLDIRGVRFQVLVGARFFFSPHHPDQLRGPPSLISNEYQKLFCLGLKEPGFEVDHSAPTSAKVKNMCSIHPFSHVFMA